MNDRFAFGTPAAMLRYGLRVEQALAYARQHPLHSETFLQNVFQGTAELRFTAQRAQRVRSRPVRVAGESAQWAPPFRGIIIVDHAPCDELLLTVLEDSTAQEEKIGTVSIPVGRVRALGRVRGTRALQPPGAGALEMELEWLDF